MSISNFLFIDWLSLLPCLVHRGKTSQVYFGVHKKTGEKVAIKVIDRRRIVANPDLIAEVGVLKKLSHPNIISLKDVFITPDNLQIVMELYVLS